MSGIVGLTRLPDARLGLWRIDGDEDERAEYLDQAPLGGSPTVGTLSEGLYTTSCVRCRRVAAITHVPASRHPMSE